MKEEKESQNGEREEIKKKLKDALTEKMIVDGLIKKEVVNENQVIDNLGFRKIFERESNLPEDDGDFKDLEKIQ